VCVCVWLGCVGYGCQSVVLKTRQKEVNRDGSRITFYWGRPQPRAQSARCVVCVLALVCVSLGGVGWGHTRTRSKKTHNKKMKQAKKKTNNTQHSL